VDVFFLDIHAEKLEWTILQRVQSTVISDLL